MDPSWWCRGQLPSPVPPPRFGFVVWGPAPCIYCCVTYFQLTDSLPSIALAVDGTAERVGISNENGDGGCHHGSQRRASIGGGMHSPGESWAEVCAVFGFMRRCAVSPCRVRDSGASTAKERSIPGSPLVRGEPQRWPRVPSPPTRLHHRTTSDKRAIIGSRTAARNAPPRDRSVHPDPEYRFGNMVPRCSVRRADWPRARVARFHEHVVVEASWVTVCARAFRYFGPLHYRLQCDPWPEVGDVSRRAREPPDPVRGVRWSRNDG